MKIKKVKYSETTYSYHFICPGCDEVHAFNDTWQFNQDFENPTISPSFLMRGTRFVSEHSTKQEPYVCHSFIKEGKIQYLGDCTHKLANQTVELPHFKKEKQ